MSPANLNIPLSSSTVSVKPFNVGQLSAPWSALFHPILPGHHRVDAPIYAFLIENNTSKRRVMFDLGVRKDLVGIPPRMKSAMERFGIVAERDVADHLKDLEIPVESVETIIWSHPHLDHTGDPSTFPSSTRLKVGPGVLASVHPGFPEDPESSFFDADLKGREVTEIQFDDTLSIGGFRAFDYFSDGSFYLLDIPGHTVGHICALARVSTTPTPSFLFLAADTAHHPAQLRPNPYLSLHFPCPEELLPLAYRFSPPTLESNLDPDYNLKTRITPLLGIPPPPNMHSDPTIALESMKKLGEIFDASPDVLVVLAHDASLVEVLLGDGLDNWRERGVKRDNVWAFLKDFG